MTTSIETGPIAPDSIAGYSVKLLGWVCGLHDTLVLHQDNYEAKLSHFRLLRSFVCDKYDEACRKELFIFISQIEEEKIHELFLVPKEKFLVALLAAFTQAKLLELCYQRRPSYLSPITEFRQFPGGVLHIKSIKVA